MKEYSITDLIEFGYYVRKNDDQENTTMRSLFQSWKEEYLNKKDV